MHKTIKVSRGVYSATVTPDRWGYKIIVRRSGSNIGIVDGFDSKAEALDYAHDEVQALHNDALNRSMVVEGV